MKSVLYSSHSLGRMGGVLGRWGFLTYGGVIRQMGGGSLGRWGGGGGGGH